MDDYDGSLSDDDAKSLGEDDDLSSNEDRDSLNDNHHSSREHDNDPPNKADNNDKKSCGNKNKAQQSDSRNKNEHNATTHNHIVSRTHSLQEEEKTNKRYKILTEKTRANATRRIHRKWKQQSRRECDSNIRWRRTRNQKACFAK